MTKRKPLQEHENCKHPRQHREDRGFGWIKCHRCQKSFRKVVKHGTFAGYNRHRERRDTYWPWPVAALEDGGCGCQEAATEARRELRSRPENISAHRLRDRARMDALLQLRRAYPGDFLRAYREGLQRRALPFAEMQARRMMPAWDEIVGSLIKAAMENDEATIADRVREGWASPKEREVMRQARRLRMLLGALIPPPAARP